MLHLNVSLSLSYILIPLRCLFVGATRMHHCVTSHFLVFRGCASTFWHNCNLQNMNIFVNFSPSNTTSVIGRIRSVVANTVRGYWNLLTDMYFKACYLKHNASLSRVTSFRLRKSGFHRKFYVVSSSNAKTRWRRPRWYKKSTTAARFYQCDSLCCIA